MRERFALRDCLAARRSHPNRPARTHADSRLPRPQSALWLTVINSTEAYSTTDRISWAHPENAYKNHVFADEERNSDTFKENYHGHIVVKEDKRSGSHGAAAIIMCFKAGQIALGAPGVRTRSNGEVRLCHNLNLADAKARRALHGTPIYKQVSPELNTQLTAKLQAHRDGPASCWWHYCCHHGAGARC